MDWRVSATGGPRWGETEAALTQDFSLRSSGRSALTAPELE